MERELPLAVAAPAPVEEMVMEAYEAEVAIAEVEETGAAVTFRIGGRSGVPSRAASGV